MNLIEVPSAVMGSPPAKNTTGRTVDRSAPPNDKAKPKKAPPSTDTDTEVYNQKETTPADPEKKGEFSVDEVQEIERTAQSIQQFLDANSRELNFQVNRENGEVVVEVYRKSDGKLIRKIPPEDLLKPQAGREMSGLLIEENA